MKTRKAINIVIAFAIALLVLAPMARASEQDQATQLTFTQPVQLPGDVVLQPGTYWFTLLDSASNRNMVRVSDANWQPVAIILATATELAQPSDNTLLTFAEISADQPAALLSWAYPGNTIGHEFVYSGAEGRALSERTANVVTVIAQPAPLIPAQ